MGQRDQRIRRFWTGSGFASWHRGSTEPAPGRLRRRRSPTAIHNLSTIETREDEEHRLVFCNFLQHKVRSADWKMDQLRRKLVLGRGGRSRLPAAGALAARSKIRPTTQQRRPKALDLPSCQCRIGSMLATILLTAH